MHLPEVLTPKLKCAVDHMIMISVSNRLSLYVNSQNAQISQIIIQTLPVRCDIIFCQFIHNLRHSNIMFIIHQYNQYITNERHRSHLFIYQMQIQMLSLFFSSGFFSASFFKLFLQIVPLCVTSTTFAYAISPILSYKRPALIASLITV